MTPLPPCSTSSKALPEALPGGSGVIKKFIVGIVLFFMPLFLGLAKGPATSAAKFLELGAGPRAMAMGEIGTAITEDSYASYWNPAALSRLQAAHAGLMHNRYLADIEQQFFAYAAPTPNGGMAFSVTRLSIPDIPRFDVSGNNLGSVKAGALAVGLSQGMPTEWPGVYWGGSFKWVREELDSSKPVVWLGDLGLLGVMGPLRAAFVYTNLGQKLGFDQEKFPVTQSAKLGFSYQQDYQGNPVVVSTEAHYLNERRLIGGVGLEYTFNDFVTRVGYRSAHALGSGLRAGFGMKIGAGWFDYAWAPMGEFGAAHRFGLSYYIP